MAREVNIPAQTYREEIRSLEEYPGDGVTPGVVRVTVSRVDEEGRFMPTQAAQPAYVIEGQDYDMLVGDGDGWAEPGKPAGTYRNEDLWHFIDLQRAAAAGA